MNRNVESHFSQLPQIDIERSTFDRSSSHKTAFNVGDLIPVFVDEVLPGDTFKITTSVVARLQTLLAPIMDNIYLDTFWFFCPSRILWTHWKEFMGENTESPWLPQTEYSIPTISPPYVVNGSTVVENGWNIGTIADYMGIPTLVGNHAGNWNFGISALPFRGYALICDQWFRDQNLTDPLNIPLGDSNQTGSNGSNYINDVANGGMPFKVAKYHDFFTSCLPSPQKSQPISIFARPIGENDVPWSGQYNNYVPVVTRTARAVENTWNEPLNLHTSATTDNRHYLKKETANSKNYVMWNNENSQYNLIPDNLWADVGGLNLSINQLRLAFQLQKYFEKNARAGSRYREILAEHFSITPEDSRMMIPEYLGGHRFPLAIHQVANTSESQTEFLGDLGAMSNTSDVHEDVEKSFSEHGYIYCCVCARYDHSYPQGLSRMWTRSSKLDFYWPVFQSLGELPTYKYQLYLDESSDSNDVFGYNEAWAEYRFPVSNRVSSYMRPSAQQPLSVWHLADNYSQMPSLSDGWIREDKANVDRTLAVTSVIAPQIFADFYFQNTCTRPMPMYSIPGLIDHH